MRIQIHIKRDGSLSTGQTDHFSSELFSLAVSWNTTATFLWYAVLVSVWWHEISSPRQMLEKGKLFRETENWGAPIASIVWPKTQPFNIKQRVPHPRVFSVAQTVKNLPAVQETWVQCLGQEDPLEKGVTTPTPVFLPGEFHGQRSCRGQRPATQSMWSQRVRQDWETNTNFSGHIFIQPQNLVINVIEMILWLTRKQQAKMPDDKCRPKSFEWEFLSFRLETISFDGVE